MGCGTAANCDRLAPSRSHQRALADRGPVGGRMRSSAPTVAGCPVGGRGSHRPTGPAHCFQLSGGARTAASARTTGGTQFPRAGAPATRVSERAPDAPPLEADGPIPPAGDARDLASKCASAKRGRNAAPNVDQRAANRNERDAREFRRAPQQTTSAAARRGKKGTGTIGLWQALR